MTPLFAISGFANLLSNSEIPLNQKEQANQIVNAIRQLQHLFNEVLTFIQQSSEDWLLKSGSFQ